MGRLEGKVALVTGGARGQGESEGRLFASEGARVVLADVREDEGRRAASSIGEHASYVHLDVTGERDWQAAVDGIVREHGRIDVLVNNAAIVIYKPLEALTLADYRRVIEVNQVGVFLGMKAVVPAMRRAGTGSIINISSVSGLRGRPDQTAYAASKWAVRGMSRVAARELAASGIRVNTIHPGAVETPLFEQAGVDEAKRKQLLQDIPLGTIADPEDVARMALFLASNESAYCTGAEFVVDGGLTA